MHHAAEADSHTTRRFGLRCRFFLSGKRTKGGITQLRQLGCFHLTSDFLASKIRVHRNRLVSPRAHRHRGAHTCQTHDGDTTKVVRILTDHHERARRTGHMVWSIPRDTPVQFLHAGGGGVCGAVHTGMDDVLLIGFTLQPQQYQRPM